jgi:hypothetical protein
MGTLLRGLLRVGMLMTGRRLLPNRLESSLPDETWLNSAYH